MTLLKTEPKHDSLKNLSRGAAIGEAAYHESIPVHVLMHQGN